MPDVAPHFQLLQASADSESESELRILVDGRLIKYLNVDPGLYNIDDLCFGPLLPSVLPPLPPGDWNEGRISRNSSTGRPHFSEVTKSTRPGITSLWHPLQIEYLDLRMGLQLRSNVYEVTCPHFDSTIVAKLARFAWEVPQLDDETSAYQRLEDSGIGPKFLGHLSEEGRVIGFIIERITDFRHATPEDLPLCQQALSELHKLKMKHGDPNKHNFLIHNGKATLIDFDHSKWCSDEQALNEEYQSLAAELSETSGRGGIILESEIDW
jgi:hypothetical protein